MYINSCNWNYFYGQKGTHSLRLGMEENKEQIVKSWRETALLRRFVATPLRCYAVWLLHRFVATLPRYYAASLLRRFVATPFGCYTA
ncbi:hypothetical protein POVWA2_028800 [Plasmodium ovale wallikeri]|uniref:Uncharacterized protein n=1 Tax=Plasmodium ovale wallikeri TaxID=864142 RepID=A0A1A8YWT1_PLAOA|nr:hypothetical protein POVWA2_028800 [Plasmodium ovale wallikeri]